MMIMGVMFAIVFAVAVCYLLLRRERNGADPNDPSSGFSPQIGFTRLDGMASLSLLLINKSSESVWAEDVEIFLSGLTAEQQTAEASCREIQKIRQTVQPGDTLPISLAEVIYRAAGHPQRKYSCMLSPVLRYRVGQGWSDKRLENYKIRMIGLTADGVQRARRSDVPLPISDKFREVPETASKLK
jgi:hypothetical protein